MRFQTLTSVLATLPVSCLGGADEPTARTDEDRDGSGAIAEGVTVSGEKLAAPLPGGADMMPWGNAYKSDAFIRQYSISDPTRLMVRTQEWNESTGTWTDEVIAFRTSFKIRALDTRGGNEFYLLGSASNGDDVIEQWVLEDPVGSWTTVRTRAETGFGVPFTGVSSTTAHVVGGVHLADRKLTPDMERIELYRGSDYGRIVGLMPDFDGRFVHFLGGKTNPGLFTIGLFGNEPTTPAPVLTTADIPELSEAVELGLHHHPDLGWTWFVHTYDSGEFLCFDQDNDGTPDSFDLMVDSHTLLQTYPDWDHDWHDWWW